MEIKQAIFERALQRKKQEELATPFGRQKYIEENFKIVNKDGQVVPFFLNKIQTRYLFGDRTNQDIILKARQQGFSSEILALFTVDFLETPYSRSVVVADIDDNAIEMLDKVKFYIGSWEDKNKRKVNLKYNSRNELYNQDNGARYSIGTAQNTEFGRSKTITNLHLSEAAFYRNLMKIITGAGQALTPSGHFVIETTANGFNEFKDLWDEAELGTNNFQPHFYRASDFYDKDFLERKRRDLKDMFFQEYPETAEEAFISSGEMFFDKEALKLYQADIIDPIKEGLIYV
jgi:hypothetical protein